MKYEHIIFDLDGTLLDSIGDITHAVNLTMKYFSLPVLSKHDVTNFLGHGSKHLIKCCIKDKKEEHFEQIHQFYTTCYENSDHEYTKPYEGIIELLDALKDVKVSILSNKAQNIVKPLVNKIFDYTFFDIFGEQVGFPLKPNPKSLNEIIKRAKLPHKKTLYVGDSEVDIKTAHRAGVDSAAVTWGFRDKETLSKHNPTYLVDTTQMLLAVIKKR